MSDARLIRTLRLALFGLFILIGGLLLGTLLVQALTPHPAPPPANTLAQP